IGACPLVAAAICFPHSCSCLNGHQESAQEEHRPVITANGACGGIRTLDLVITKQVIAGSRLSAVLTNYTDARGFCRPDKGSLHASFGQVARAWDPLIHAGESKGPPGQPRGRRG